MGVWGTALFSDDTAGDIREDYTNFVGDGLSGPEATSRILSEYKSSLDDPQQTSVVWLALAAVQWQLGRLEPRILERALAMIDSGSDLKRWDARSPDYARRRTVLEKLRAQITSPQPREKKVRKPVRDTCGWNIGDLFSYELPSGKLIVFRVIGLHTDKGGTSPICEILDWVGDSIPPSEMLATIGIRSSQERFRHTVTKLLIVGTRKDVAQRMRPLGTRLEPAQKSERPTVEHQKYLDKFLRDWFALE